MILDTLQNARLYYGLGPRFVKAFEYLAQTDFSSLAKGKYEIDGKNVFAIVNEYDTVPASGEKMEAHKKHIDVQYIVQGQELVGLELLQLQTPSKPYDDEADYMLFSDAPAFFMPLKQHHFAIFFPTDLHMPNLADGNSTRVKKVVVKIRID
jgi:YhcH/YjgK/YiaL family protein